MNSLFDEDYYSTIYPGCGYRNGLSVLHYLREGWKLGYNPSPEFNTRRYLEAHPDALTADISPLEHYYNSHHNPPPPPCEDLYGTSANTKDVPPDLVGHYSDIAAYLAVKAGVFSPLWYRGAYSDLKGIDNPLEHFRKHGFFEGRQGSRLWNADIQRRLSGKCRGEVDPFLALMHLSAPFDLWQRDKKLDLCRHTAIALNLFDEDFYRCVYVDPADSDLDCFLHYMIIGWLEGRNPSPALNTVIYLRDHEDCHSNPIFHILSNYDVKANYGVVYDYEKYCKLTDAEYIHLGEVIGYLCKKDGMFDKEQYTKSYPDICQSGISPFQHFIKYGYKENRNPSDRFDAMWYSRQYLDDGLNGCPIWHYYTVGKSRGLSTHRNINIAMLEANIRRISWYGRE